MDRVQKPSSSECKMQQLESWMWNSVFKSRVEGTATVRNCNFTTENFNAKYIWRCFKKENQIKL
jgi:hypothetical protein